MQNIITDNLLLVLMLVNLALCASSRLGSYILLVAVQGAVLSLLPIFAPGVPTARTWVIAGLAAVMKGLVFPRLLTKAISDTGIRREIEPFVGYGLSIIIGTAIIAVSFRIGSRLPLPIGISNSFLIVPAAISTILTGLFLLTSRKKAVTQVMGFLTLENGIAAFGLAVVPEIPLLIELGLLLDGLVAVFVMAIVIRHISREFNHINTDQLSVLKG